MDSEDFKLWGPGARVPLTAGIAKADIVQHTEGGGERSRLMLDFSVSGLSDLVETIGRWLVWSAPCTQGILQLGARKLVTS